MNISRYYIPKTFLSQINVFKDRFCGRPQYLSVEGIILKIL